MTKVFVVVKVLYNVDLLEGIIEKCTILLLAFFSGLKTKQR